MSVKSLCLTSSAALAAVLPLSAASAQEADDAFNGFYVGVHAGGSRLSYDIGGRTVTRPAETVPGATTSAPPIVIPAASETIPAQSESTGIQPFAGGQIGFNFTNDDILVGVEADVSVGVFDATNEVAISETVASGSTVPPRQLTTTVAMDTSYTGSLRLRAGMRQQDLVYYATGGIAQAKVDVASTGTTSVPNGADGIRSVTASDSHTHTGWTAGAGILGWFGGGVIGGLEARYVHLGSETYDIAGTVDTPTVPTEISLSGFQLVARLNYVF